MRGLAEGLDLEEEETQRKLPETDEDEDDVVDWASESDVLSEEEHEQLEKGIKPIKMVIVKVSVSRLLS
jgi:hypothetical protein